MLRPPASKRGEPDVHDWVITFDPFREKADLRGREAIQWVLSGQTRNHVGNLGIVNLRRSRLKELPWVPRFPRFGQNMGLAASTPTVHTGSVEVYLESDVNYFCNVRYDPRMS